MRTRKKLFYQSFSASFLITRRLLLSFLFPAKTSNGDWKLAKLDRVLFKIVFVNFIVFLFASLIILIKKKYFEKKRMKIGILDFATSRINMFFFVNSILGQHLSRRRKIWPQIFGKFIFQIWAFRFIYFYQIFHHY